MLVHVDCLLRLVSLDELFFGFLESVLVLKLESILKMDLRKSILSMTIGKSEGLVESLLVGFKVNGSFNKSVLDKELGALLTVHGLSDLDGNLSKLLVVSISFGNSKSVLPHVVSSVHVDRNLPSASFDVVVFSLLEVSFTLKLVSKMLVGLLEEILSILGDKSDHVIVLSGFSVDTDGKIRLVGCEVHSFSVLVVSFGFEFSSFVDVEHGVFRLRKVS